MTGKQDVMNTCTDARIVAEHAESRARGSLLVVGDAPIPAWVQAWCRGSDRELRLQPLPGPAGGAVPAATDRVLAIAALATSAARRAGCVLALAHTATAPSRRPRVVAGVQRMPEDALAVTTAAECAAVMAADLVLVHGVPASFGERSVGLSTAVERGQELLDAAVELTAAINPPLDVEHRLARALPHALFGEGLEADLLVLGGACTARGGRLGLVPLSALHHAPCSILLVPRAG